MKSYVSIKANVTGFSFANLGLFNGLGIGLVSAIYSLVLLEILGSATMVGLYSSVFNVFGLLIALTFGEVLRVFSKSKLLYVSLVAMIAVFFMMGFNIRAQTFIALDFFVLIPWTYVGALLPLFMADFAGKDGMAGLNGRYLTWMNVGALFAPMIAMSIADVTGLRSVFIVASFVYLLTLIMFRRYGIVELEKKIPKITPRKTFRSIWRETRIYFKKQDYVRAYIMTFGYFLVRTIRILFIPIVLIEYGFSKDVLGIVLTLGVIPYALLSEPIGRIARRFGPRITNIGMALGFISFSACAFLLYFTSGFWMLALLVLLQIPGAVLEALHDLTFFDVAKNSDKSRFFGIFNTSKKLPRIFAPLFAALFIVVFNATSAVWLFSGIVAILSACAVLWKNKRVIR